jgi:hypothetical protein
MEPGLRSRYLLIYLLTAVGLSPGGSTHLHTNNTQNNTNNNRTTQVTNKVEECGPCPVFTSFTLAFALQLRKRHGKTSVKLIKTCSCVSVLCPVLRGCLLRRLVGFVCTFVGSVTVRLTAGKLILVLS